MTTYAFQHPGQIIKRYYLKPMNLSIRRAAKLLGVSRQTFAAIVNERHRISLDMSFRLTKLFGLSPKKWLNMQNDYDIFKYKKEHKYQEPEKLQLQRK